MLENFPDRVKEFIACATKNQLEMLLVGGGAVNFYGYQRHSADIDFWVNSTSENLQRLLKTLQDLGYNIQSLPQTIFEGEQNISLKISPVFELELITRFNSGKTFGESFANSEVVEKEGLRYHVLSFDDLILSKIISKRAKDKLDVEELHRIRTQRKK